VYEVSGDGPAVVLIHGFALDMRMWDPQIGPLTARFRVVRYDCRGFGASGPFDPGVPYTHAGDLVALLDHLGIGDAVLAGLSFGGRVALQAALAAPDRVRGLALLDAVLDGVPWDPESARALDGVTRRVEAGGVRAGREAWLAHPLFAAARERPDLAAALAAMVAGYPGQHWLGQDPHRQTRQPIDVLEGITGIEPGLWGFEIGFSAPGNSTPSFHLALLSSKATYTVVYSAAAGVSVRLSLDILILEVGLLMVGNLPPAHPPPKP
jgi:pimeloyl-ACP methyl ester carboxylesterase